MEEKNTTLQEEMVRQQKYWKKNHIWTVLILLAVLIYTVIAGPAITVAADREHLKLDMPNHAVVLPYDSITAASLEKSVDYGVCSVGKDARQYKCGTWENEAWGSYTLCVYTAAEQCVVLETTTGRYVVNMASDADTERLYEMILSFAGL